MTGAPRRVLVLRLIPLNPFAQRYGDIYGETMGFELWRAAGMPARKCIILPGSEVQEDLT